MWNWFISKRLKWKRTNKKNHEITSLKLITVFTFCIIANLINAIKLTIVWIITNSSKRHSIRQFMFVFCCCCCWKVKQRRISSKETKGEVDGSVFNSLLNLYKSQDVWQAAATPRAPSHDGDKLVLRIKKKNNKLCDWYTEETLTQTGSRKQRGSYAVVFMFLWVEILRET